MEPLVATLGSAVSVVNNTLNGPFKWIPDATNFYDDNFYILAGSVVIYLPLIFGIQVCISRWSGENGTKRFMIHDS